MAGASVKEITGAWVIHHGRKLVLDANGPAEFSAIDEAAKAATLLTKLGQSNQTNIPKTEVRAIAAASGLNPRHELIGLLQVLEKKRLIDQSDDEVSVLGVTTSGNVCECVGPGENELAGTAKRIQEGRYPLWTQFGPNYQTIGYSNNSDVPGMRPMPGILVEDVGNRNGIIIHPAHPPTLYLSSTGCFNPTNPLQAGDTIDFWDSRAKVVALINDLKTFSPNALKLASTNPIPDAWIVVDGEPMNFLFETA